MNVINQIWVKTDLNEILLLKLSVLRCELNRETNRQTVYVIDNTKSVRKRDNTACCCVLKRWKNFRCRKVCNTSKFLTNFEHFRNHENLSLEPDVPCSDPAMSARSNRAVPSKNGSFNTSRPLRRAALPPSKPKLVQGTATASKVLLNGATEPHQQADQQKSVAWHACVH